MTFLEPKNLQFTVGLGRAAAVDLKNLTISGSEAWVSSSNVPQTVSQIESFKCGRLVFSGLWASGRMTETLPVRCVRCRRVLKETQHGRAWIVWSRSLGMGLGS